MKVKVGDKLILKGRQIVTGSYYKVEAMVGGLIGLQGYQNGNTSLSPFWLTWEAIERDYILPVMCDHCAQPIPLSL